MKKSVFITLSCISLILFFGFLSGLTTRDNINNWYIELSKPSWNPPSSVFAPVWAILYIIMGIALSQIIQTTHPLKKYALTLFGFQFILNLLWTQLFFGMHQLGWAVFEILLLWLSILLNIYFFMKIERSAGILLLPYICWVGFASILTIEIWKLNT